MTNKFEELAKDVEKRQKTLRGDRNPQTLFMRDLDPNDLISMSVTQVLKGAESGMTLVDVAASLGNRIRQKFGEERDSVAATHAGWFVMISYLELGLISYYLKHTNKKGKRKKHRSYHLSLKDWEGFAELWESPENPSLDLFPRTEPLSDWDSGIHELSYPAVRKSSPEVLNSLNPEEDDQFFEELNRLGRVGWRINKNVLSVFERLKEDPEGPFRVHRETDPAKITSLRIEMDTIFSLANKFKDDTHYHLWSADFRGRVYPLTAFLHPQGSDSAKGLLLFEEERPLGENGYFWLKVHAANCYGKDKFKLHERADFVDCNLKNLLAVAEDPHKNRWWMEAEKPWSFLACCFEINAVENHRGTLEEYLCGLPVFIDGKANGIQHLCALSKDEKIAPLVSLTQSETSSDVYMFVAEKVWERLEELARETPSKYKGHMEEVIKEEQKLKKAMKEAQGKPEASDLAYQEMSKWRNHNRALREAVFPEFWLKVTDPAVRRKIVKRCVMCTGYGATRYGFGQFIQEDLDDISEHLDKRSVLWCAMMGNLIYDICYAKLEGPGRMLTLFEEIGAAANERGEYLSWLTPTGFPVVQLYPKAVAKRVKLKYGGKELKVVVEFWEEGSISESSQRSATAPNVIHSLDACHLQLVVNNAEYPLAAVHDSVGCSPGDMEDLYELTRLCFVKLYESDPLGSFLEQVNYDKPVELGNLDLEQVMDSEFFFS